MSRDVVVNAPYSSIVGKYIYSGPWMSIRIFLTRLVPPQRQILRLQLREIHLQQENTAAAVVLLEEKLARKERRRRTVWVKPWLCNE